MSKWPSSSAAIAASTCLMAASCRVVTKVSRVIFYSGVLPVASLTLGPPLTVSPSAREATPADSSAARMAARLCRGPSGAKNINKIKWMAQEKQRAVYAGRC